MSAGNDGRNVDVGKLYLPMLGRRIRNTMASPDWANKGVTKHRVEKRGGVCVS
jgi:hypothetical protein